MSDDAVKHVIKGVLARATTRSWPGRMYPRDAFEKSLKAQSKPKRPIVNGRPIEGLEAVHYASTIKSIANEIWNRK